ncbi:MAG: bifunctional DNA-formamidopyrimidine glycosylase/DNA-(apurinic or apyrimidinic site) lyase [Pseudomonadota bacterium]
MPELPEVETVRRGLQPVMEGATINRAMIGRPDLRFPFPENFEDRLIGRRVNHLRRRAKYLIAELDSNEALIMHLGMSGSFRIEQEGGKVLPSVYYHPKSDRQTHDHVILQLKATNSVSTVIYNDPRRFGFMDLVETQELENCRHFAEMGIEPTGNQLNGKSLAELFHTKSVPLKSALLDQKLIAGLGNIYVCEALWRAGLSPRRKASSITRKGGNGTQRSERLALDIRDVIAEAIEAGGSSLRDHRQTNGELGYFQHRFSAYDREGEPCPKSNCTGQIKRIVQSGRSTFFCPKCQH